MNPMKYPKVPGIRKLMKVKEEAKKFRPFRLSETANVFANMLNKPINQCFVERKVYLNHTPTSCSDGIWREIGDLETANMLAQDARDLREIRNHVIKGRMDLAARAADELDTCVREAIPSKLYNILQEYI